MDKVEGRLIGGRSRGLSGAKRAFTEYVIYLGLDG